MSWPEICGVAIPISSLRASRHTGRKYSKHGTIKINLNEDGYDVVLSALREKLQRETEPVPLTDDGCQNLPNKYGSGVYMNAPCRMCVRGIRTHDFYKPATEPKGEPHGIQSNR